MKIGWAQGDHAQDGDLFLLDATDRTEKPLGSPAPVEQFLCLGIIGVEFQGAGIAQIEVGADGLMAFDRQASEKSRASMFERQGGRPGWGGKACWIAESEAV